MRMDFPEERKYVRRGGLFVPERFGLNPAFLGSFKKPSAGGATPTQIFFASALGTVGGCSTTAQVTTGSTLFIAAIRGYRSPYPQESSSPTTTWTQGTGIGASGGAVRISYATSPTTSSSQTFSTDGGDAGTQFSGAGVFGYSGVTAFDAQSAGAFLTGNSIQPGSLTPAGPGELFISIVSTGSSTDTFSIDSGWTIDFQGVLAATFSFAVAHKVKGSSDSAAENPTWTRATGDVNPILASIQACFK